MTKRIAILRIDYKQTIDGKVFLLEVGGGMSSSIKGVANTPSEFNKVIINHLLTVLQGKKLYLTNAVNNETGINYNYQELKHTVGFIKKINPIANISAIPLVKVVSLLESEQEVNLLLRENSSKLADLISAELHHSMSHIGNLNIISGSSTCLPLITNDKAFTAIFMAAKLFQHEHSLMQVPKTIGVHFTDSLNQIARSLAELPEQKIYLIKPLKMGSKQGVIAARSKAQLMQFITIIKQKRIYALLELIVTENGDNYIDGEKDREVFISSWKAADYGLIQEFIPGILAKVEEELYHVTGRAFIIASEADNGEIQTDVATAFWVLPEVNIEESYTYKNSIVRIDKQDLGYADLPPRDHTVLNNALHSAEFKSALRSLLHDDAKLIVDATEQNPENASLLSFIKGHSLGMIYAASRFENLTAAELNQLRSQYIAYHDTLIIQAMKFFLGELKTIRPDNLKLHRLMIMSAYNYLEKADKTGQRIRTKTFLEEHQQLIRRIFNKLIKIHCKVFATNKDTELMDFILAAYKQYAGLRRTYSNYPKLSGKTTTALQTTFFRDKRPEPNAFSPVQDVIESLKQMTGKDWKYSAAKNIYWVICEDIEQRDFLNNLFKLAGVKPKASFTKENKQPIILLNNLSIKDIEIMIDKLRSDVDSTALMKLYI